MSVLRIGTRSSALALWQAKRVAALIGMQSGSPAVELVHIRTEGDVRTDVPLWAVGGRAFFTERIDELHVIFGELLEELSQQYGLGYQSTNRARNDTWRQIKVDVEGQPRVRARQGYRPSSSSSQRR